VRLALLDASGRDVRVIADGEQAGGTHLVPIDVQGLPAGLYFLRLQSPGMVLARRLVVLR
jgi:hypothetical protein